MDPETTYVGPGAPGVPPAPVYRFRLDVVIDALGESPAAGAGVAALTLAMKAPTSLVMSLALALWSFVVLGALVAAYERNNRNAVMVWGIALGASAATLGAT
jgi:hypothetical protein